jgi:hypothetical protein
MMHYCWKLLDSISIIKMHGINNDVKSDTVILQSVKLKCLGLTIKTAM